MRYLLKLLLLVSIIMPVYAQAESKTFVKEYTYNASDDDSKNNARKKAITQLKSLLSEEVGTLIKSSIKIHSKQENDKFNKIVDSNIESLSSNFMKLSILDERWNGSEYYVKAKVTVDSEQAQSLIEKLEKQGELKTKRTFVEMQKEQPMFVAGKFSFTADKGDVYEVVSEIDCLKGNDRCWVLEGVNVNKKGVAKAPVLKSFHKVYTK